MRDEHGLLRPVVTLPGASGNQDGHTHQTRMAVAERIARLMGMPYAGDFDPQVRYPASPYFVPGDTLLNSQAAALGIRCDQDLFGGVVPHPFLLNKTISHGLVSADAAAPAGWSSLFSSEIERVVLPGYSAFSKADARRACMLLEGFGPLRIKQAQGVGGSGQWVVADALEGADLIDCFDEDDVFEHGLVIELNLEDAITYSVGHINLGPLSAAYYGTQHMVRDRQGSLVYGGSDIVVTPGDFADLLTMPLPDGDREAIARVSRFDAAALRYFPAMYASRRNYDVVAGRDRSGRWHYGVLEQSWRFGGASPAETVALEYFRDYPDALAAHASVYEIHEPVTPPENATVHFHNPASTQGPFIKYTTVRAYGNPA